MNAIDKKEIHREKCRILMRKNYNEHNGKERGLLKYYKKLYKDNDEAMSILTNKNTTIPEKLKEIKIFHFYRKISNI